MTTWGETLEWQRRLVEPCPFCGRRAAADLWFNPDEQDTPYQVRCGVCWAPGPECDCGEESAVVMWLSVRPTTEPANAEEEGLDLLCDTALAAHAYKAALAAKDRAEKLRAAREAKQLAEALAAQERHYQTIDSLIADNARLTGAKERVEAGIVEARRRLAKGRATWNGPCHECDGVLAALLPNGGRT